MWLNGSMKKLIFLAIPLLGACASTTDDRSRIERYGDVCYYVEEVDVANDYDRDSVTPAIPCPDLVRP